MKFIATTSNKVQSIPEQSGQLIFSRDDRIIYLDSDIGRTSFEQIITLVDENTRLNMTTIIEGFYFVKDTCILWYYNNGWKQITNPPSQSIIFIDGGEENLPTTGQNNTLYITDDSIFRWNSQENKYITFGGNAGTETSLVWEAII